MTETSTIKEHLIAAHTPGPWSYRPSKYDDWGFVRAEPVAGQTLGHLVAVAKDSSIPFELHDEHRAGGTDPFEANARLIAAAPDLLEACRQAAELHEDDEGISRVLFAAIAKAEGRQP